MMDFLQRVKQNSKRILRMKPAAISPAASVKKAIPEGAWSEGKPLDRLAGLCNTVLNRLAHEPVLTGRYDGHKGLKFAKNPAIWVGPIGGKSWKRFFSVPVEPAQLAALVNSAPSGLGDVHQQGLEVLDLSELEVCDWKGCLSIPQVGRLVLLAPQWRLSSNGESGRYFGLVLDFDQRLMDARSAVDFLDAVVSDLLAEKNE